MGIALGEAACRPASGSLIAEYFSANHRAKVVCYLQQKSSLLIIFSAILCLLIAAENFSANHRAKIVPVCYLRQKSSLLILYSLPCTASGSLIAEYFSANHRAKVVCYLRQKSSLLKSFNSLPFSLTSKLTIGQRSSVICIKSRLKFYFSNIGPILLLAHTYIPWHLCSIQYVNNFGNVAFNLLKFPISQMSFRFVMSNKLLS